jgi:hypothetical protein
MRPIGWDSEDSGFTLVNAMVGMAIGIFSLYALVEFISNMKGQDARVQKRIGGEALLLGAALDLQQVSTDALMNLCVSGKALAQKASPSCTDSDRKRLTGTTSVPGDTVAFGVRTDWNGVPNATGPFCLDLVTCRWRAGENLLELVISGVWETPGGGGSKKLAQREMVVRRVR